MDTITHVLLGTGIAQAMQPKYVRNNAAKTPKPRHWLGAGALAALVPDADHLFVIFGGPLLELELHRGISHSLVMAPLWIGLASFILGNWIFRPIGWRALLPMVSAIFVSHVLLDALTGYGTQLFAPLWNARLAWPVLFIIDFYLSGILIATVLLALLMRCYRQHVAKLGLLIAALYIGYAADYQHQAAELVASMAPEAKYTQALPQPLSAKNWQLVIERPDYYEVSRFRYGRLHTPKVTKDAGFFARIDADYPPIDEMIWQHYAKPNSSSLSQAIWEEAMPNTVREFLQYAVVAYPRIASPDTLDEMKCIWFTDLRFNIANEFDSPFRYGACAQPDSQHWNVYHLNGEHAELITTSPIEVEGSRALEEKPEIVFLPEEDED